MRSKEVEEKIHMLKSYAGMTHKQTDNQGRPKLDQAIDTVLTYIEKLEKENMGLLTRLRADSLIDRDNYWKDKIRNKIKELEKLNFNNYANEYDNGNEVKYYILKEFKELLGE